MKQKLKENLIGVSCLGAFVAGLACFQTALDFTGVIQAILALGGMTALVYSIATAISLAIQNL